MTFSQNPALIVTADTIIGLTVMRSLGRRGVPVYCAWSAPDALGPKSTYCLGSCKVTRNSQLAFRKLIDCARQWKVTHIIGIGEQDILWLNQHRGELESEYTLMFPPASLVDRVLRKDVAIGYAKRLGIPVPHTIYPQSLPEVEQCRTMDFPVIVKPAYSYEPVADRPRFQHKYLRIECFDRLWELFKELDPGPFPMIQEYIPGTGLGISILMREGKPVLAFQHRRIREFPPNGGVGVLCESMNLDSHLFAKSVELLVDLGWDGVAMVEYRRDEGSGRYAFMEINGRFWGSLPTAVYAGADFPFCWYRSTLPDNRAVSTTYKVSLRARSLAGDTKWLFNVLKGRKGSPVLAVCAYLKAFRPSTYYFIWRRDDPIPAVTNFLNRFNVRQWLKRFSTQKS